MDYAAVLEAVNSWSLEDRIRLVEAVSQGIDGEQDKFELTEELKQELDRRIAEDDANPDEGLPWEEVRAQILAELHEEFPSNNFPHHGEKVMTEALQQLMPQINRLTAAERDELLDFVLATLEEDRAKQDLEESGNAKDAGVADKPFISESRKEFP